MNSQDIANTYIEAWNETDAERRRALIARSWSPTASYADPLAQVEGHAGIDALIGGVQTRFPGHRFKLSGTPDGFADRLRFS